MPDRPVTVEFWMQPETLPAGRVTVAQLSVGQRPAPAVTLRLTHQGELELDWLGHGQTLPGVRCRIGAWTHVALAWDGKTRGAVRIDGQVVPLPEALNQKNSGLLTHYTLGGDVAGGNGFCGLVDELRVSDTIRQYYAADLDWPDVAGQPSGAGGQPWFRDAADLVFHA